jgi:hypothetical protein
VTESEGTTQGGGSSTSSGSSGASRTRRKTTGTRRKAATRRKSRAAGRKTTSRPTSSAKRTTRRRATKPAGLESLLNDLARRAERAGTTISGLSEEGANAARRGLGVVTAASRKTITRVRREWDAMDNTRRIQFVGALLAALGAAAAGVRKATKK